MDFRSSVVSVQAPKDILSEFDERILKETVKVGPVELSLEVSQNMITSKYKIKAQHSGNVNYLIEEDDPRTFDFARSL